MLVRFSQQQPSLAARVSDLSASSCLELYEVCANGDFNRHKFQLPPSGKKAGLCFGVGGTSGRSTVWRLFFGSRTKSDIYLASRHSADEAKISFHESGHWHFARTSDSSGRALEKIAMSTTFEGDLPPTRFLTKGTFPTTGPCLLGTIQVPWPDLSPDVGGSNLKDVEWLPRPPDGCLRAISLMMLADTGEEVLVLPQPVDVVIGGFRLPSGRTLLLVSHTEPLEGGQIRQLQEWRQAAITRLRDPSLAIGNGLSTRCLVACGPLGEPPIFLDLAADCWGVVAGAISLACARP